MNVRGIVRSMAVFCLVGAAGLARGQNQDGMLLEVSLDNIAWSREVTPEAGGVVFVRVRAIKSEPTTVMGLAGVSFQPTISGFAADDEAFDLTNPCGEGVMDVPGADGPTGRILPFASGGQTGCNRDLPPFCCIIGPWREPGDVLRYRGERRTTTITTGLSWGIGSAQSPRSLAGSNFNSSLSPVLFKAKVRPVAQPGARSMVVDVPLAQVGNARINWHQQDSGLNPLPVPITQEGIVPAFINRPSGGCDPGIVFSSQPAAGSVLPGEVVTLAASATVPAGVYPRYQWMRNGQALVDDDRVSGARTPTLTILAATYADSGVYALRLLPGCAGAVSVGAAVVVHECAADLDDGAGAGIPDGGVTIEDLLYFFARFEEGSARADLDDGSGSGNPDGGVTIEDLLFFAARYGEGC